MTNDAELLAIDYQTLFVTTASGRIERENDPDRSPGPRFWLAGCASGNVAGVGSNVADDVAAQLMTLAVAEPPFVGRDDDPKHLHRYIDLLSGGDSVPRTSRGLIYQLPHRLEYSHHAALVDSESEEGKHLLESFSANGMPGNLKDQGFSDASDLWAPWCIALHDGEVASIAFAARLSEIGAELGVATAHLHRGRGYAAAATAGWSALQSLRSRALFYSTDRTNVSSQKVVARLGLRFLGASLRLS